MPWNLYWTITIQVFAFLFIISWPVYVVTRSVSSGRLAGHRDNAEAEREIEKKIKRDVSR